MLPQFKKLRSIAIYTPDLPRAVELYRGLGLEPSVQNDAGDGGSSEPTGLPLRFAGGSTELVLHSDPQRQFVELTVTVDDVAEVYRRLARHPDYTWLETPHRDRAGWRAVVRLPDDNIFTLRSPAPVRVATQRQG